MTPQDSLATLTKEVIAFRDARDWKQFHNAKDVAVSLSLEASEFLELFQWKTNSEAAKIPKPRLADELADVLYWVLLAAHDHDIDAASALRAKLESNEAKYPVAKARGTAAKYTEL